MFAAASDAFIAQTGESTIVNPKEVAVADMIKPLSIAIKTPGGMLPWHHSHFQILEASLSDICRESIDLPADAVKTEFFVDFKNDEQISGDAQLLQHILKAEKISFSSDDSFVLSASTGVVNRNSVARETIAKAIFSAKIKPSFAEKLKPHSQFFVVDHTYTLKESATLEIKKIVSLKENLSISAIKDIGALKEGVDFKYNSLHQLVLPANQLIAYQPIPLVIDNQDQISLK